MRIKIVSFLAIIQSIFYADTLHIYLNTNTCKNCNLLGKQLEGYTNLKKILYLTVNDFRLKEDILERFNLNPINYEIKSVNNDFFNPINGDFIRSYCVLKKGMNLSDTFLLGDLSKLNNDLSKPNSSKIRKLKLDKRIKLSDAAVPSIYKKYILFFDSKLNRTYVTQLKNDSVLLVENISPNIITHEDFLKCKCFDENLYNYLLPTLKQLNLTKPEIENVNIKNSTLNIMIGYNVGITSTSTPETDTMIDKKLYIYTKDIETSQTSLTCINYEGNFTPDPVFGKLFFVTNSDFIKSGDTLYLPIITNDSTKKSLFVNQLIKDSKVKSLGVTRDLNDIVTPSLKFTQGNNLQFNSRARNETEYYFIITPLIYNIATKKTVFLNNLDLLNRLKPKDSAHLNYYINDAKINNGIAHLLIGGNESWNKEEYDLTTNKLLKSSPLNLDKSINGVLFMPDMNSFFIYSSSKNEFYISE